MSIANNLSLNLITYKLLLLLICFLITPSHSDSFSIRGSFSDATVVGKDAPENFDAYDISSNFDLPWKSSSIFGLNISTRLMTSAGILRWGSKDALVVSIMPELLIGSKDGRYYLDIGGGLAFLSRYRFGTQDFGDHLQFAFTSGITIPLYEELSVAYRYMHYSDGGVHGSGTTGADLHMIELTYNFN